jgi:vitamin B12 transporter
MVRVYALDDDIAFSSPGFAFQSDDAAHLWGAQGQIVLAPWAGHLLTFGTEYQGQVIAHTDNTPSAFSNVGSDLGLYVEDDWQAAPSTLFSVGVREDIFQIYGTQVNPRAGVVVLLCDRLSLRAAAGRTFRAPSFDELAPSFSGNPALQPETAWEYNLGLEYALAPDLSATVTGYYKDATNLITSSPPTFVPMNVGHAIVTGGSAEIVGRLTDRWFVRANYTNQRAQDASSGQDVIYVPRQLGTLDLTYQLAPGSSVNVIVSYLGDQFADTANTTSVPGHWLTSLTTTWPIGGGLTLQAGVSNLFDVSYQESLGFPEPGRRYYVTATTSL